MRKEFKDQYGPMALITGASAGIGSEFAMQLASLGFDLVLVARRKDALDGVASSIGKVHNVRCTTVAVDLSTPDFMETLVPVVSSMEIGLLVNNAGFALTAPFLETNIEDELRLLHLNTRAPLLLTHHFGQLMVERGRGGVIFLASIAAFSSIPEWSNYCATKSWNLMMGEALFGELRPHGVDVLSLCPGATRSEFGEVAGLRQPGAMEPGAVVRIALDSLGRMPKVVTGVRNRAIVTMEKFLPRRLNSMLAGRVISHLKERG